MRELSELLEIARSAVGIGDRLMTTAERGEVHEKGDRDFVTDLDVRVQKEIRAYLEGATPDIDFLGEEEGGGTLDESAEYVWVLDPIDGTSNFAHGLPLCACQLALVHRGEPVLGVIAAPFLGKRYHAAKGLGAFCDGEPIRVRDNTDLKRAIFSLGDFGIGSASAAKNELRFGILRSLADNVERVRMFGSAALDLAFVAEGRTDGCIVLGNKPWDTAPGVVLVREAGGTVIDRTGAAHTFGSAETVAGGAELVGLPDFRERTGLG
ncbi:inositol monophosphatase family protein [Amycolatopsis minnesotensis]|uniref:Inositol monophosphatase family protein n=1 Tax=Amycolatopsis minnesotensis TaxID=337894 RepID=A0ABP5CV34_9PSEU